MSRAPHTVRVVSYNLRALKDSRQAIVEVIHTLAPDVLLLQEVPRHPFSAHRIAALAADLGLTWGAGSRGRMSTTLMTSLRLDVLSFAHHNLPVQQWDEPRGYAVARVRVPGYRPFTAISTHLSLRPGERPGHTSAMLASVLDPDEPVVIGGDINEKPGSPGWSVLAGALPEATPDEPTFPSSCPVRRIDAIFASPVLHATTPPVDLDRATLAAATDHCPVWTDLDVRKLAIADPSSGLATALM